MKRRLKLDELKVESFITKAASSHAKGGGRSAGTGCAGCPSNNCGGGGGNQTAVNCGSANPC